MSAEVATSGGGVTLHRLIDLEAAGGDSAALIAGIGRIFRETAARWPDAPNAARAFQDLWLDQYLQHDRDLALVALAAADGTNSPHVVGYLVGCRIDPATSHRFASLDYFSTFAAHSAVYPAHLHINVDADYRGRRIGEHLVDALRKMLRADGHAGVHVVTGRDQRNVHFYTRLGFRELARTPRGATEVLFLARAL